MSVRDRVTLITGAARGIGAETARLFAVEGARVFLLDRDHSILERSVALIKDQGGSARGLVCNITEEEAVTQTVEEIIAKEGRIDILINNAGITRDKSALKMSAEQWRDVVEVNLTGTFLMCHAVGAHMRNKKFGRIINTASTSAWGKFGQGQLRCE